jgi:hypothetical protein
MVTDYFNASLMTPLPTSTLDLQRSIRREKVMRARSMSEEERLVSTLDQIDAAFEWMREGIRQESPGISDEQVCQILTERLDRQRRREDRGLYVLATTSA